MTDQMSFEGLVGAALGPAFSFLFGCLKDLLIPSRKANEPTQVEMPEAFRNEVEPLVPEPEALSQSQGELELLKRMLEPYASDLTRINEEDSNLKQLLEELKTCLERVYGKSLPLEKILLSRHSLTIKTQVKTEDVRGSVTGMKAGNIKGSAKFTSTVEVKGGDSNSEVTGVEIGDYDGGK